MRILPVKLSIPALPLALLLCGRTPACLGEVEPKHLREHWLNDVVYHGWPREVVEAPARFDETRVIETGKGYRIRKLRYEIVPGFYSAALLYEPQDVQRGSPAILNVNGHVGAPGKSVEYKQKRCIQFAKQGILALNLEPGTHNYQQDNRLAAYRFFAATFHLPPFPDEGNLDAELRSYDALAVGLPTNNLTILGLAQKLGREIARPPLPANQAERARWVLAERARLKEVVRHNLPGLAAPWPVASARSGAAMSICYVFDFAKGLSANGVLTRLMGCPEDAPVTLVLNDKGKKESAGTVAARVSQGEQVLALDLAFFGDAWREVPVAEYEQIIHGLGERPLGILTGQLIEIARWMRDRSGGAPVRVESTGLRHQVAVLDAAALEPGLFSEITIHEGVRSLSCLLETPVQFSQAPELFCLDFYKHFDLDRLQALTEGVRMEFKSRGETAK